MFDPKKQSHRNALGKAIEWHFTTQQWMRDARVKLIRDFAGSEYGRQLGFPNLPQKTMLPLMQRAGQAFALVLSYHCPRFKMVAKESALKGFAKTWEASLNERVASLHLERMLRTCAMDSFFAYTVVKTYRGQEPVGRVSPDDFVFDTGLKDMRRSPFFADRYRTNLDFIKKESGGLYDKKWVDSLKPVRRSERDKSGAQAWQLSEGGDADEGEFEEMVELSDVYISSCGCVGTWATKGGFELDMSTKPGAWQEWRKSDYGCYRVCTHIDVPDNAIPVAPAVGINGMFRFVNVLMKKIALRARNQQDLGVFPPGKEAEIEKIKRSRNETEWIQGSKDAYQMQKILGVDQPLWSLMLSMLELSKEYGGNLDAALGLSPTAETLGQSEMIAGRQSMQEGEYKSRWTQFVSEIGEDIADDMYDNPEYRNNTRRKVGSTDYTVDASWGPPWEKARMGTIDQYEIRVIPYSWEYKPPLKQLSEMFENFTALGPLLPLGLQQGVTPNFKKIVERVSELRDDPDFSELWDFNGIPPGQPGGEEQGGPTLQDNQPHEYIRRNVSGNPNGGDGRLQELAGQMGQAGAV